MENNCAYRQTRENSTDRQGRHQVTIDVLPDNVLLDIFDFYLNQPDIQDWLDAWQLLVHVCRRWRSIVFQSPRRLNLQLYCTVLKPVRKILDVWPALPLVVYVDINFLALGLDNFFAALEHRDRVRKITIGGTYGLLEAILPVMHQPFPALKSLHLTSPNVRPLPCIPDSFLGGSTPHLRYLHLEGVLYPALPKLLLTAPDLVTLTLQDMPYPVHITPQAVASALSVLTSLELFDLGFKSPKPCPDRESRHPRAILPALTNFVFQGASEYLEDLVSRIDAAPLLGHLSINFFNQTIFHTPHLAQFICRIPKFQALNDPQVVVFVGGNIAVNVPSRRILGDQVITMGPERIGKLGWQPSFLAQLYTSSLRLFLTAETLFLTGPLPHWRDIENIKWVEFLQPFTAVKNLYLSENFAPCIASALQELVGERVLEVLPALQKLFLAEQSSGAVQQAINEFVEARQLSGYPIAFSRWAQERYVGGSRRKLIDG